MQSHEKSALLDALIGITGALIQLSEAVPQGERGRFNQQMSRALDAINSLLLDKPPPLDPEIIAKALKDRRE
jgi:hypothetical protein